jgi:hypothetical protein
MKIINTAGPSPESNSSKFNPQKVQFFENVRNPSKSFPFEHPGQEESSPAFTGETGVSEFRCSVK